jgi:hypothetical protein
MVAGSVSAAPWSGPASAMEGGEARAGTGLRLRVSCQPCVLSLQLLLVPHRQFRCDSTGL